MEGCWPACHTRSGIGLCASLMGAVLHGEGAVTFLDVLIVFCRRSRRAGCDEPRDRDRTRAVLSEAVGGRVRDHAALPASCEGSDPAGGDARLGVIEGHARNGNQ